MLDKKPDAPGVGVLSLYVLEGSIVCVVVTRALALHGYALELASAATAAVVLLLWAAGWPTYARMQELAADAAQRALHPGSTFKGRAPPRGIAGAFWQIARITVGALYAAHAALYRKVSIAFRPPLV